MDAQWLNQQFDKFPDKSKSDLSELLGIQPSGISKMLAGTRQIKAKEYMLMRKFFEQPGHGQSLGLKKTGILSNAGMNDFISQGWTQGAPNQTYNVIEVSDAGMLPDFLPGERVLIDIKSGPDEKSGIFALEENGKTILRIIEKNSPLKLKISALSKDAPAKLLPYGKVRILGRVIAKLNWL